MKNKRLILIISVVALILLIPFLAMQFTDEVNWTLSDFVIGGGLLLGTGLLLELVLRKFSQSKSRIAICVTIIIVLFLVCAELAVGIFGTPLAGS